MPTTITFKKPATLTFRAAGVQPVKAITRQAAQIDLTKILWKDNPGAQTVTALYPGWPDTQIMGAGSPTPYDPNWTEQQAEAALLVRLGVDPANIAPAQSTAAPATPVPSPGKGP